MLSYRKKCSYITNDNPLISRNYIIPAVAADDSFCSTSGNRSCGSYVISFTLFNSRSISDLMDCVTTTQRYPLNGPLSRTLWVSRYQKISSTDTLQVRQCHSCQLTQVRAGSSDTKDSWIPALSGKPGPRTMLRPPDNGGTWNPAILVILFGVSKWEASTLMTQLDANSGRHCLYILQPSSLPFFYDRCPSCCNRFHLSLLGTGTKYTGLHTVWFALWTEWQNKSKPTVIIINYSCKIIRLNVPITNLQSQWLNIISQ